MQFLSTHGIIIRVKFLCPFFQCMNVNTLWGNQKIKCFLLTSNRMYLHFHTSFSSQTVQRCLKPAFIQMTSRRQLPWLQNNVPLSAGQSGKGPAPHLINYLLVTLSTNRKVMSFIRRFLSSLDHVLCLFQNLLPSEPE